MSNIDKRALREAAEKATPGPWGIARNGKTITSNQSHPVAVITEDFHRLLANGKTGGDAEFIAAANPTTVLALLDELEAAEKRIAEQDDIIANQNKWVEAVETTMISTTDRAEAAEKRIAELEAREINLPPYSFFDFKQGSTFKSGAYCHIDSVNKELSKHGIKMIAAAGKGEAS